MIQSVGLREYAGVLTVENDPIFKSCVGRVGDEKKHINKPNQPDFARPLLSIDRDFPWVDIAALLFPRATQLDMIAHTSHIPLFCHELTCQNFRAPGGKMPC